MIINHLQSFSTGHTLSIVTTVLDSTVLAWRRLYPDPREDTYLTIELEQHVAVLPMLLSCCLVVLFSDYLKQICHLVSHLFSLSLFLVAIAVAVMSILRVTAHGKN